MLTQNKASEQIATWLEEIDALMRKCEKVAMESKVDFYFESPCGRSEAFDATGEENDGKPMGWDQSQC